MKRYLLFLILFFLQANAEEFVFENKYLVFKKPELHHIKTFHNWNIYHELSNNILKCYAISSPYNTKAFHGIRSAPYLVIAYKGYREYTLSLNSGFILDKKKNVTLTIDRRSHLLYPMMPEIAWTSSSTQDKSIIQDMIKGSKYFTIRTYNTSGDTALDFYSLDGLLQSLKYMENNC